MTRPGRPWRRWPDDTRFADRRDAGRRLVERLRPVAPPAVVVGLARGGVIVGEEIASALALPLGAVAVRKVGHPLQPELGIGAVAPGGAVYLRNAAGLGERVVARAFDQACRAADLLERDLHSVVAPVPVAGTTCLLVDDGLATGSTMIAAIRWARAGGAARVMAVVPVASEAGAELVAGEADALVCPLVSSRLGAVGGWYHDFRPVAPPEVIGALAAARARMGDGAPP